MRPLPGGWGTPVGSELARPPSARPPARRVCWLGPEPQGTPKPTFFPSNGSPCHHLGHGDRQKAQNCGAHLTRGVAPPQSQLFFDPFWIPKIGKCQFLSTFRNCAAQLRANLGPMGPHGHPWGAHGRPWAPHGGPKGPQRAPGGHIGPPYVAHYGAPLHLLRYFLF